jgi:FKBP-type peptidyl-prolyl cis-trans isomerase (trigger factor)
VSPTEITDNTKKEIQVEIPADEVGRTTDSLIQKYQKLARLPGFRRGHVPASIIRQRFSEDIKSEVVETLVPRYFRQEAAKQGLIPVSQPRVTDLHVHDGEPLRFKASFEVMPEIKVEFNDNLRGASAGEEKTFEVTYPQDYSDQRLAGHTFTYTVNIQSIKQKSLPELNDDFAKELGAEFTGIEDVKKRIREGTEAEKKHRAEHEAKDKLLAELVKRNDFPVPESLVEHQIDVRLDRGLRALAAQGMRAEDMKKMDLNRLRAGQRDQAVQEVKASLLLDKVADEEKIEVSDQEVDHEIEALAQQSKQTPEAIRARLTRDGALDRIKSRIRNEKTLNFLYQQSA